MLRTVKPRTVTIEWQLRQCMATSQVTSARALHERLTGIGLIISPSQVRRLCQARPRHLPWELLEGLCTALECAPSQLLASASPVIPSAPAPLSTAVPGLTLRPRDRSRGAHLSTEDRQRIVGPTLRVLPARQDEGKP